MTRHRGWHARTLVAVGAAAVLGGALAAPAGAFPGGTPHPAGPTARSTGTATAAPTGWRAAKAAALRTFTPPPPATVTLTSAGTGKVSGVSYSADDVSAVVHVGPGRSASCTIVGELLVPGNATAAHPRPVIMMTNGFGGSYDDSTTLPLAENAVADDFVALTYSGLGFGGSSCQITLDSPQWDGAAASQLISWLGDQPEITKDGTDDPRIGMIGGSYGGAVQLAAASVDPRLDAIVPMITWNDLDYSLAPNNDTTATNRTDSVPGVLKWEWATLFFADGQATPVEYKQLERVLEACPGFDSWICTAFLTSVSLGYPDSTTVADLRADSMVTYWRKLHLPVLLAQGEDDSLFQIQEAVDNMRELQANGDPVQLVWQSWGHSDSTPAPGELDYSAPFNGYENILVRDFFDKWLLGEHVSTGAPVQYFRPWVTYSGNAAPAYGSARSWPVGSSHTLYLSSAGTLVTEPSQATAGTVTFANPPGGIGTSYSETADEQGSPPFSSTPASDLPGSYASFESAPLTAPLDMVGVPTLTVKITSSVPTGVNAATDPVVYGKIYDLAPDGTKTLVDRLVAPIRIADTGKPVTITLPGIVHRYPVGDRLDLVLAAGDFAYLGNRSADTYTITLGSGDGGVLHIPAPAPGAERSGGGPPTGD